MKNLIWKYDGIVAFSWVQKIENVETENVLGTLKQADYVAGGFACTFAT